MRRSIAFTLVLAVAVAIALGAIMSSGDRSAFPLYALLSLMYGLAIGVPAMLILRRLRPRLYGRPELQQWLIYVGTLAAIMVIGTLVVRAVLVLVGLSTVTGMWSGTVTSLGISAAIAVPSTIAVVFFQRLQKQLGDSEREKERALALATDARLASLESRTRPHFLFNALNSAIALIPEDARRAEQLLERLCALLRFSLDAHVSLVPLAKELEVVVDYLEIERVRFGERISYELDVADDVGAIEVPAFALQTLVENSVKYAVSPRKHGATIRVRARRSDDQLVLDVTDDGPGFTTAAWLPGHGLTTLRARLDALYGSRASLSVPTGLASTTTVSLAVPLS